MHVLERLAPFYDQIGYVDTPDSKTASLHSFSDQTLELLIELQVPIVSFHFGIPAPHAIEKLKSSGCILMATATTVKEAKALEISGIDVVVAQGWEAGGHRGSFSTNDEGVGVGTFALVPQIVDAVKIPVVASGGIGDGRGVAAAFVLGASGVWMGTAFLTCFETPITEQHRDTIFNAVDDDTHLTRAFSGRPCRAKKTPYSIKMSKARQRFPDFPTMYNFSSPLKKYGIVANDINFQFFLYGQAASLNRKVSAEELISQITKEAAIALTTSY